MNRRRTRSPGLNRPVQFWSGPLPLISAVKPCTSSMSVGIIRISPQSLRSARVAARPFDDRSAKKSAAVRCFRL